MNTKTTLYLAVVLVVLGALYLVVQSRPAPADVDAIPSSTFASSAVTRDLLEEKLGDVVKVVYRRKGGEEWVFEKDADSSNTGQAVWRMTAPLQMKCVSWEVSKFGNRLGRLQYELSYNPAEPGAITPAKAGLEPPEATVTLTDADGKTVTVEIGKPASNRETYVRLAGSDVICVGKSDLKDLLKDKAIDFREKQLWDFKGDNVTRVEITDRSNADEPVTYTLSRDGSRWMMESPVTAQATSKVDDMLRAMARLRAIRWLDDDAGKLAMYGLKPAARTVRVTVEEEVPVEVEAEAERDDESEAGEGESGSDEEAAEPATQTKVSVYELHLSDRSPIGEETKVYMRVDDEQAVATVMKSSADTFKPVMSQWREMHVTTANVSAASEIELTTRDGSATLTKKDGTWRFQPDGGQAEDSVVDQLLTAIADLTAVVFIDEAPADPAAFGLDDPQAVIRLTIPGVEGVERITVGDYTDQQTKRLVYVRRDELASVAKVRAADVTKLLQGPRIYRDRTIVEVLPSRFERLTLSTENRFTNGRSEITLERTGNEWSMVAPVSASVREQQVDKLVEALGGLRARQVVADGGEASAFGLHAPARTVTLTYTSPLEGRMEEEMSGDQASESNDASESDTDNAGPVEDQPPSQTLTLSVTAHDGKIYAKRSDRPTIYEVDPDFYRQLIAEYRTDRVLEFDDEKVRELSIRKGDETHVFEKKEDRWTYRAEPDLPLDANKVKNLLLQVRDLRTPRYVAYAVDKPSRYGLDAPLHEVTVTLEDGTAHTLWVSSKRGDDGTSKGFYAQIRGDHAVFLLTADSVRRFEVSLDDLEEKR